MKLLRTKLLLFLSFAILIALGVFWFVSHRPKGFDVKAHYTKYEYRIPMRDGVKLFTSVYVPKDTSHPYPFLLQRTPFAVAPYGTNQYAGRLGPSESMDRSGYIYVFQDVRGRYQSEGVFVDMRPEADEPKPGQTDESTDTYDTIEWLLKNIANNNGNVGIWGLSYRGFYASAGIINSHSAIKAASPEAPVTDLFRGDDAYHNGAFMLDAAFLLYSSFFKPRANNGTALEFPPETWKPFDYGTNDGYQYFLQHGPDLPDIAKQINSPYFDAWYQHDTYDDYWQARDVSRHLKGVKCAVLTVGGWFDAEDLAGTLRTYRAIEKNNAGIFNVLVMGPWAHGGWLRGPGDNLGKIAFGSNTGEFWRDQIVFTFFEHYLKGSPEAKLPEAYMFETGSNTWRQYAEWPPKQAESKTLYFHAEGKLSFDPPAKSEATFDQYVSDPANPVPYVEHPPTDLDEDYMVGDQRFVNKRPDVITYLSDVLAKDVTVVGPVAPHLQVSSSGTDSDYVLKLIDVAPDGYEMLVRGEPMRAKFRNSWTKPEAMKPDQVTAVNFEMPDVNHTFRQGHRIMVQVQSSWFPLADLNPQKFIDAAHARREDFQKATERIYHTPQQASGIRIGVLP